MTAPSTSAVPPATVPRRTVGVILTALCFLLLGVNAWKEAVFGALDPVPNPVVLIIWQGVAGALALATAFGAWLLRAWSAKSAIAYGAVTGTMIVSLRPILDLDPGSQPGLWTGGIMVLGVTLLLATYLHRATRTPDPS